MNQINMYVGEDGKLHFVDCEGADTVLPFNHITSISGIFYAYLTGGNTETYTTINKLDDADITKIIIKVNRQLATSTYIRLISYKNLNSTIIAQYSNNNQPPALNTDIEFEISDAPDYIRIQAQTVSGGQMQYTTVSYVVEFGK